MKKSLFFLITVFSFGLMTSSAQAMFNDDPWLTKVVSEIEYFNGDEGSVIEWDTDFWVGRDLSKYWIKSSGEYADSEFEDANIEFVYSRAKSAYWDQQFGVRHDFKTDSSGSRNWVSYGFIGTAPYFIEVDARVFVGEQSSTQLLIEFERELMITQQWVLTPELDIIANGRTNEAFVEGSGLAEIEFSVRLGYEPNGNRKFQPFLGLTATQAFGSTRRLAESQGSDGSSLEAIAGIHFWF